jgi:hypothetical protein
VAQQNVPGGWVPLIPAKSTAAGPGGQQAPAVLSTVRLDAANRRAYVLARATDLSKDAFLAFAMDGSAAPDVVAVPDGWFATSCSGAVRLISVSLSPIVVLSGSNVADTAFMNPCGAAGFLALNLATETVAAYPLGSGSQMAAGTLSNFNDFVYGTNTDPSRRNTADTVFVFDGASPAAYTVQLPVGSVSFAAVQPVANTNWLLATVTNRVAGDGGLVLFDLLAGTATLFPIPEGFTSVQLVGTFLSTNKLVARGLVTGSRNYQLLVFDLATQNVATVSNPDGVASFGPLQVVATPGAPGAGGPGGPGGPGTLVRVPTPVGNAKANTVAAPAYDAAGKQSGMLLVRVP